MSGSTRLTLAAYSEATDTRLSAIEAGIGQLLAASGVTADAPARTRSTKKGASTKARSTKAGSKKASEKTLTRGVWKRLRVTKSGVTKKAFVGLTREQAFEKGLCPGYRLPTGELRASLKG